MSSKLFPSLTESLGTDEVPGESLKIPRISTIEYNISTIVDMINNIDHISDQEIKDIIMHQYETLLDYNLFLANDTRKYAQKLFSNKRFLSIFIQVINLLRLSDNRITCINKLVYDYYILPNKDPEVSTLLLNISYTVNTYQDNNRLVIRLSSVLTMNNARVLSMIARSAFKEEKVIRRVNNFLLRCKQDLSVQNIIDIYCILFNHFEPLFIYTMILDNNGTVSQEYKQRYDNISLAIIYMLDSMTSSDIKTVLLNYGFLIRYKYNNEYLRFSMRGINQRIDSIISDIEIENQDLKIK